jgi:hypothetical protein
MVSECGVEVGLLIVDGQVLCELCAGRWKDFFFGKQFH